MINININNRINNQSDDKCSLFPAKIREAYTRSGVFKAEEVFSLAWLRICGFSGPLWFREHNNICNCDKNDSIIIAIDGGKYGKNKVNKEFREDGTPYSAFGLIVKDSWNAVFHKVEDYFEFDEKFVKQIDSAENGIYPSKLCKIVSSFYPTPEEILEYDILEKCAEKAVSDGFSIATYVAKNIMEREIKNIKSKNCLRNSIANYVSEAINGCIYLDFYMPIAKYLVNYENIKCIGYYSTPAKKRYTILSVKNESRENKLLFPIQYRGKTQNDLPRGMLFCNKYGFLAEFEDKEQAINIMNTIFQQQKMAE